MNIRMVLSMIDSLEKGWYGPPVNYYWKKRVDFECLSYKHSAIKEIKMYLKDHLNTNPIDVVEDFRCLMDDFVCSAQNETAVFMFSIYYDVATDVLDILLGMK